MNGPAYWAPDVQPADAKTSPVFASILHAGPWQFSTHPNGGTLATFHGASRDVAEYRPARPAADGLQYLAPLVMPSIHDLTKPDSKAGVDVQLCCGLTVTIPHGTVVHQQLRLGRGDRMGDPVTEYGRLCCQLYDSARTAGGLDYGNPALLRLIELALGQCYRLTQDLIDDMAFLAADDVDPILGAAWCGDPKALAPASSGMGNALPISGSTGAL